jgi:single-stranded DNA-binding protein
MNNCTFTGFLSKDPENNNGVVKFSIAQNEKYNDVETTTWLNFTAFKKQAETAASLRKGDFVFVSGKYQTNEYEGKTYPGFIVFNVESADMWKRRRAEREAAQPPQAQQPQGPPQPPAPGGEGTIPF